MMNKIRASLITTFGFTKFFTQKGKKFKNDLIDQLKRLKVALAEENEETQKMLEIYYRFTIGETKEGEMERANEQFRSMLKTIGLGFLAVLPFSPVTIPLIVKLGQTLGIDILPNSFKDKGEDEEKENEKKEEDQDTQNKNSQTSH